MSRPQPPATYWVLKVRVPPSGVVKIPGVYPHEFASTPLHWKTVETTAKYVHVPVLEGRLTWGRP